MIPLKSFTLFILCLLSDMVMAQKQNNVWCFGDRAGLDFNSNPVSSLVTKIFAHEGSASISDPNGQLLFYTNGSIIWDRNHNVMPNGTGLAGGASSTQAALIVPLPASEKLYYVFTTEDNGMDGGLSYSVVDLSLNSGFGDVVTASKNTLVVNQTAEKVTAVLHANGVDIWIITHRLNSNEFLSYLLSDYGLDPAPTISAVGSYHPIDAYLGPIKASHSGTQIACSAGHYDIAELFDFDRETGQLTNAFNLSELFTDQQFIYGIEFSPNDSLLYLSNIYPQSNLYQIDITTKQVTFELFSTGSFSYGLQLGPDRKLYIASHLRDFLGIIHQPDQSGIACQYEEAGIMLAAGTNSRFGLPPYVPYSYPLDTQFLFSLGNDTTLCTGDSLVLSMQMPTNCGTTTFLWNDGSTDSTFVVYQPGTYWVRVQNDCFTIMDSIQIHFVSCWPLIYYNLDGCTAYMINGSNMDYSEFEPDYPYQPSCAAISASVVYRSSPQENKHSCTPGVNGSVAMCISARPSCFYIAGHESSLIMEVVVIPSPDSTIKLTGLEFYEKSPTHYSWINGGSGLNDYPRRYAIRILKNGVEIFLNNNVVSTRDWTLQKFNFIPDDAFIIRDSSTIRIELLPYCTIGNGAEVSAWDIDEIRIFGGCAAVQKSHSVIQGEVLFRDGQWISNVDVLLGQSSSMDDALTKRTDGTGFYRFDTLESGRTYFLQGNKNDDLLNGVSTLDLIHIQKHLLGITPFTTLDQYIAADVNRSGTISVLDLIAIQKLLLGMAFDFPGNTSWRFGLLPQDMSGADILAFREMIEIESLEKDTHIINLVGIKIGDVNGDAQVQLESPVIRSRRTIPLHISMENTEVKPGVPFSVDVRVRERVDLEGMQFALQLNDLDLLSVDGVALNLGAEHYSFSENGVFRMSWSQAQSIQIDKDDILFRIVLQPTAKGLLSKSISIPEQVLLPEAYLENFERADLCLMIEEQSLYPVRSHFLKIEPNPAYSEVKIHFYLDQGGYTEIRFIDASGQVLHSIQKTCLPGKNVETVNLYDFHLMQGVAFCQIRSNGFTSIEKVMLLK